MVTYAVLWLCCGNLYHQLYSQSVACNHHLHVQSTYNNLKPITLEYTCATIYCTLTPSPPTHNYAKLSSLAYYSDLNSSLFILHVCWDYSISEVFILTCKN